MLPDEDDLPPMEAHHIDATTGEDDVGEGQLLFGGTASAAARPARRSQGSREPGARSAATSLPLRLGQEIQALPRGIRLEIAASARLNCRPLRRRRRANRLTNVGSLSGNYAIWDVPSTTKS